MADASSLPCCRRFLNVVDFGMNVQDAVDAPRFHHQWMPDKITMERGFSPDTIGCLKQRGHTVETASAVARVFAIVVDDGWLQGGADGRSYGKAEGLLRTIINETRLIDAPVRQPPADHRLARSDLGRRDSRCRDLLRQAAPGLARSTRRSPNSATGSAIPS